MPAAPVLILGMQWEVREELQLLLSLQMKGWRWAPSKGCAEPRAPSKGCVKPRAGRSLWALLLLLFPFLLLGLQPNPCQLEVQDSEVLNPKPKGSLPIHTWPPEPPVQPVLWPWLHPEPAQYLTLGIIPWERSGKPIPGRPGGADGGDGCRYPSS